jgi:hypothetical protein
VKVEISKQFTGELTENQSKKATNFTLCIDGNLQMFLALDFSSKFNMDLDFLILNEEKTDQRYT